MNIQLKLLRVAITLTKECLDLIDRSPANDHNWLAIDGALVAAWKLLDYWEKENEQADQSL